MKRYKGYFVAVLAILVMGTATLALAQEPGSDDDADFGPELKTDRMAKRLGLSEEQVASIKDIRSEGKQELLELRKEMARLRLEKRGEMLADSPETDKVLQLTRRIGDLRTEMQTNRMRSRLEVRNLLTAEQRDKMLLMGGGPENRSGRGKHGAHGRHAAHGKHSAHERHSAHEKHSAHGTSRGHRGCESECDGEGSHRRGNGRGNR